MALLGCAEFAMPDKVDNQEEKEADDSSGLKVVVGRG